MRRYAYAHRGCRCADPCRRWVEADRSTPWCRARLDFVVVSGHRAAGEGVSGVGVVEHGAHHVASFFLVRLEVFDFGTEMLGDASAGLVVGLLDILLTVIGDVSLQ